MILPSSATRSSRLVCENVSKARRAAATALSTSALEPSATSYIASSVAGLTTGVEFLTTGSTQAPSLQNCLRLTIVNLLMSGANERGTERSAGILARMHRKMNPPYAGRRTAADAAYKVGGVKEARRVFRRP